MGRAVRGVLVVEGVQTGDGRVVAEGAVTWADLPLPLGWLEREQHGNMSEGAVQVGTIDTIERVGNELRWTGTVDDGQADGAEMVRRMTESLAPMGARWGVSIDPDDWELEIIATEEEDGAEGGVIIVASGSGEFRRSTLTAAAGDPDVGDEGVVLFEDAADSILERYTRLRIRGATAVAMGAFAEAYMELADAMEDGAAADTQPEPVAAAVGVVARANPTGRPASAPCGDCDESSALAAAAFALVRSDPLAEWFGLDAEPEDVVPVGIDANTGRIWGYTALWGTCHIGQSGCVTPPMSASGYRYFHTGATRFAVKGNAHMVPTGRITMGIGHAPLDLAHAAAVAHYDNTRWNRAAICNHENGAGIWYSGALHRSTTEAECAALLACGGISGDWRPIAGTLEHVAALAVNVPGFPVPRSLTAAAPAEQAQVRLGMVDGEISALVGAGLGAVFRSAGHRRPARSRGGPDQQMARRIASLERQLAELRPQVAGRLVARIGPPAPRRDPAERVRDALAASRSA